MPPVPAFRNERVIGGKRPREEPDPDAVSVGNKFHNKPHHDQLVQFWRKGKFCDVTIEVDDHSFPAHRCVLAGGSDFFANAFDSGFSEAVTGGSLRLEQVSASAFTAAAEFFYCAGLTIDVHSLLPLLETAHFLQARSLQTALIDAIAEHVKPSWFMDAWMMASALALPSLQQKLTRVVTSSNDQLRAFSRAAEFASLPVVVRETVRPQCKSLTLEMERDGSAGSAKIAKVTQVLACIGAQSGDISGEPPLHYRSRPLHSRTADLSHGAACAASIDKQARVTIKWWVDAVHCGGRDSRQIDFDQLQACLAPRHSFSWPRQRQRSDQLCWDTYEVGSVYVADGYPKVVRLTAASTPLRHYALTVDVGLRCRSARRALPF